MVWLYILVWFPGVGVCGIVGIGTRSSGSGLVGSMGVGTKSYGSGGGLSVGGGVAHWGMWEVRVRGGGVLVELSSKLVGKNCGPLRGWLMGLWWGALDTTLAEDFSLLIVGKCGVAWPFYSEKGQG